MKCSLLTILALVAATIAWESRPRPEAAVSAAKVSAMHFSNMPARPTVEAETADADSESPVYSWTRAHNMTRPAPKPEEIMAWNTTHATREHTITARNTAGVYWCSDFSWKGSCHYAIASDGLCHATPNIQLIMGSFGPDHGIGCTLYFGTRCDNWYQPLYSPFRTITCPGWDSFKDSELLTGMFSANSFKCHWL